MRKGNGCTEVQPFFCAIFLRICIFYCTFAEEYENDKENIMYKLFVDNYDDAIGSARFTARRVDNS